MPKTKRRIKKEKVDVHDSLPVTTSINEGDIDRFLEALDRQMALADQKAQAELERIEMNLCIRLKEMVLGFPYPNKTLAELEAMSAYDETVSESTLLRNTTKLRQNATVRSGSKDDTMLLKSMSTVKQRRKPRLSRSLSRTAISRATMTAATPANRTAPMTDVITPKIKPNAPQVLLRHPKQGEFAVSMQGSPLMVSGTISDDKANVNIPLQDGRVLSIRPQRGLRTSEIPHLDPQTKRHIQTLRDNLNRICAFSGSP